MQEHYGIKEAALHRIEAGAVNLNYRVEAPGATYVLKRYDLRYYTPEAIRHTCEVQEAVSGRGVPVPAIIRNLRGEVTTSAGGAVFVLSAFVAGRQYERGHIPARAALAMGATLGQLLEALRGLTLPAKPHTVPDPSAAMAHIATVLRHAEQGTAELDRVACQVLRPKLATLERLTPMVPAFSTLTGQWVHGDYQNTNVLHGADGEVVAVIDFDNLRVRPAARELMRALAHCFPDGSPEAEAFFRGYSRTAPMDPAAVALYVPYWNYVSASGAWPLDARYLDPSSYQSRWDRFIQAPTLWWERQEANMTRRFLELLAERQCQGTLPLQDDSDRGHPDAAKSANRGLCGPGGHRPPNP